MLKDEKVKDLGWTQISHWLESLICETKDSEVNQILEQFIDVIHEIVDERDEIVLDECKKIILKDKESFETAIEIEKSLKSANLELMRLVFETFEEKLLKTLSIRKQILLG